jgi:alkylated DNA repair dioxygenase AlkB
VEIITGTLDYFPAFLAPDEASRFFRALSVGSFKFGAGFPARHVVCLDTQAAPEPWAATLDEVKRRLDTFLGRRFNSVLINYYHDGNDGLGFHSDGEPELGDEPTIATVSFGAARPFVLRSTTGQLHEMMLEHGSLVVMKNKCQKEWCHSVPHVPGLTEPRISLTFRTVSVGSL